jgi:hypothetical protein
MAHRRLELKFQNQASANRSSASSLVFHTFDKGTANTTREAPAYFL